MTSLYSKCIMEKEGKEIIEEEHGYATYEFLEDNTCYIVDIFVEKEYRNDLYASKLADKITDIAKERGCTMLVGSVCLDMGGVDSSVKVLHKYGMRISHIDDNDNMIYFKKEIR